MASTLNITGLPGLAFMKSCGCVVTMGGSATCTVEIEHRLWAFHDKLLPLISCRFLPMVSSAASELELPAQLLMIQR